MKYEEALEKIQDETYPIDSRFNASVECIDTLKREGLFGMTEQLEAYKYFKQATIGDCNIPQPPSYRYVNRSKYNAWNSLKEKMTQDEAKLAYINMMLNKAKSKAETLKVKDFDYDIEEFFASPDEQPDSGLAQACKP